MSTKRRTPPKIVRRLVDERKSGLSSTALGNCGLQAVTTRPINKEPSKRCALLYCAICGRCKTTTHNKHFAFVSKPRSAGRTLTSGATPHRPQTECYPHFRWRCPFEVAHSQNKRNLKEGAGKDTLRQIKLNGWQGRPLTSGATPHQPHIII